MFTLRIYASFNYIQISAMGASCLTYRPSTITSNSTCSQAPSITIVYFVATKMRLYTKGSFFNTNE